MMEWDKTRQDCIFRWVTHCEMLYGQDEAYYITQRDQGSVIPFDFSRYYVLISGLDRHVYRPCFGMDAFGYTAHFRETELEIVDMLGSQGVTCMTAMLLYDHTKRFAMIFSVPSHFSAQDVAGVVSGCFNRLYAKIFDMSRTVHRNYTVLSEELHGFDQLHDAFERIDQLSRQQFFDMRSIVMTQEQLDLCRVPADREQLHEDILGLHEALRSGDESAIRGRYRAMMARLRLARDIELLEDVLGSARAKLRGVLASRGQEMTDAQRAVFSPGMHATIDQLSDAVETLLLDSVRSMADQPAISLSVQEAMRFIRHHYKEDISLSDVAAHIGMSESWLSRRFSQECANSIPAYLLSVRMEHAKALLEETDMHVFEVARAVGISNPRYFVSVFRKACGVTPTAYRESLAKEA